MPCCRHPTPHPSLDTPQVEGTAASLLCAPPLPKKPSPPRPARRPAWRVPPPQLFLPGPPSTTPKFPSGTPGEWGAVSQAPPLPGAGRQRRARASSEPLGCLLRLPTASVPGEVSKASDPRTGMRKASSKQSQLPAPAQGGRRGENSRPRGTARHGTARHGTARHGTARHGMAPCTRMHGPNVFSRGGQPLGWGEMRAVRWPCHVPSTASHRDRPPEPLCPPSHLPPSLFFGSTRPPGTVPGCRGAAGGGCFTPRPAARPASSGGQRTSRTGDSTVAAPGPHLGQCYPPQVPGGLPTGAGRDGHGPACPGGARRGLRGLRAR